MLRLLQAFLFGLDGLPDFPLFIQRLQQERLIVIGIIFQFRALHLNECLDIPDVWLPRLDFAPEFSILFDFGLTHDFF